MAGRRRYKSAYRMTSRRKAALRKAQLVSARKRKGRGLKKAGATAGILATGVVIGVLGTKYGPNAANMAKDLKNRGFRFNNPANKAMMTPAGLEANIKENAVSPATAARQAPPVQPPRAGGSTPKPNTNTSTFNGWGDLAVPGKTTQIPPAGKVVDPFGEAQAAAARDPNQRKIHPMAEGMTRERIFEGLRKAGVNPSEATWREIAVLAEVQAEYLNRTKNAGFKISGPGRGNRRYTQYYRSILDIAGIPSAGDLRRAQKEGKA